LQVREEIEARRGPGLRGDPEPLAAGLADDVRSDRVPELERSRQRLLDRVDLAVREAARPEGLAVHARRAGEPLVPEHVVADRLDLLLVVAEVEERGRDGVVDDL